MKPSGVSNWTLIDRVRTSRQTIAGATGKDSGGSTSHSATIATISPAVATSPLISSG